MNRTRAILISIISAVAFAVVGTWYLLLPEKEVSSTAANASEAKKERKVLYWTDPMVPGFKSEKPGKSPFMDMELVPVYEEDARTTVVSVRPEIANNLGVRTYKALRGGMSRTLATQGYLFRESGGLLVLVDILDREATWVRMGLPVEIRLPDLPGRIWHGLVESVTSDADIGARSLKARVRIMKPDPSLKPNMYADIIIKGIPRNVQKIMVPREALIRTGYRTAVVLALGDGRFQPVEVVPGEESGDWIEIQQGIKEGDLVVVSGQFLIDSEASVRASFSRMQASEPAAPGTADAPMTPAPGNRGGN
jgi:multidrug efflux pump subunit AcrA (membrane-fusion protein)